MLFLFVFLFFVASAIPLGPDDGFVDFCVWFNKGVDEKKVAIDLQKRYSFIEFGNVPSDGYWYFRKMLNGPADEVGFIIANTALRNLQCEPSIREVFKGDFAVRDKRKKFYRYRE
ncbi:hypothetical protein ACOME3_001577 [Neoechinorhynchus agilis]